MKQRYEHGDSWSFPQLLADITADELRVRECFQEATHVGKLKRIEEKSEREMDPSLNGRKHDFLKRHLHVLDCKCHPMTERSAFSVSKELHIVTT